jgi:NAD(P)-dependent dehydrogenase (short-subunit alcohol dehydrogenase family)
MATIPAGRYGEPDEFGRAGAFLLSRTRPRASPARALQVDGGLLKDCSVWEHRATAVTGDVDRRCGFVSEEIIRG